MAWLHFYFEHYNTPFIERFRKVGGEQYTDGCNNVVVTTYRMHTAIERIL